ncbi:MAG: hypothetical protein RLZZ524_405, partial [Pseudomonadota bacterium]
MSLSMVVGAKLALRGRLQFRATDGSILKEVDIVEGALPAVAAAPAVAADLP